MAKKTHVKKTVAKPTAKPVVPAVVVVIRAIATNLVEVPDVPKALLDARTKLAASIDRYANRVAANLAGAGKKAEKEAAKVKREATKKDRDADKRTKKVAARDALREKLAKMEKDLDS